jgi:hypothetical protein
MTLNMVAPGINRLRNSGEWCSGDISCCAINRNTGTELCQDREPPSDGKSIIQSNNGGSVAKLRTKASQQRLSRCRAAKTRVTLFLPTLPNSQLLIAQHYGNLSISCATGRFRNNNPLCFTSHLMGTKPDLSPFTKA